MRGVLRERGSVGCGRASGGAPLRVHAAVLLLSVAGLLQWPCPAGSLGVAGRRPAPPAAARAGPMVKTLAGNGTQASLDGPVSGGALLSEPHGIALAAEGGGVYFSEFGGQRFENLSRCMAPFHCAEQNADPACMSAPGRSWNKPINSCDCGCDVFYHFESGCRLRLLAGGRVTTVAGSGVRGFRDGPAHLAQFDHLYDVEVDGTRAVLLADAQNHRIRVWDTAKDVVSTLAGTGRRGHRDGRAAEFNYPTGLALDPDRRLLYVADRQNNCIRSLAPEIGAAVSTAAGNCSLGVWGLADGPAASAVFSGPTSLALLGGALYITDAGNGCVRVLDLAARTVSTLRVAKRTGAGVTAPLAIVPLDFPIGIAVDAGSKALFVSEFIGGRVVQYSQVAGATAQQMSVLAGNGSYSFRDGPAGEATFRGPKGLAYSARERELVVADWYNQRLRAVSIPQEQSGEPTSTHSTITEQQHPNQPQHQPQPQHQRQLQLDGDGASPIRVMVWTGHSGPYHDHIANGLVLAHALNASTSPTFEAVHETQEAVFAPGGPLESFDVLLIYADTYENPLRGSLTAEQWQGLFAFAGAAGKGLFALHTASACWMNANDTNSSRFHHEVLNAEFGGHSPYKDYLSHVVDPHDAITAGLSDYAVTDELYFPKVYDPARSTIFLTAYDMATNTTAIHGLRHTYRQGRVLYFAQGHDMAEFETPDGRHGNGAFQTIVTRCLLWLAGRSAPARG